MACISNRRMINCGKHYIHLNQTGHSSPSVTLNVYAHLIKPHDQSTAKRLETTIFETSGRKMVATNKKEATADSVTP